MNYLNPILPQQREAKLKYLDGDYQVLREGEFVRCAVTNDPIRLDNLRYWNIDKQVAYKSAWEAFLDYKI
jgi:hypothetical protein